MFLAKIDLKRGVYLDLRTFPFLAWGTFFMSVIREDGCGREAVYVDTHGLEVFGRVLRPRTHTHWNYYDGTLLPLAFYMYLLHLCCVIS
jgi:hypothetical protein